MTGNSVNGGGNGARSGAHTLLLLATPLTCLILRSLSEGPKQQGALARETGSPAQTTLRGQLKRLVELGAIDKHRRNSFPGVLEYELTAAGRELLAVVDTLERWLAKAPDGPLTLGGSPAKAAIKALAESWSTTMVRTLAAGPLSLTELDRVIASLSYPSLERRLGAMRLAGLVESRQGNGRGTPYALTEWLRHSIAPLTSAARWERRHLPQTTAPIARLDVEASFLVAVPMLRLPSQRSGTCRIAAELPNGPKRRLAGVVVSLREGEVVSRSTELHGSTDAWALGSPTAWLDAVIEHDTTGLELGGDCRLARSVLNGLYEALFGHMLEPLRE